MFMHRVSTARVLVAPARHSDAAETVFRLLNAAGVRWCLLRAPGGASATGVVEVDVLLAPASLSAAVDALREHAFVPIRAPGHYPHRFFVGLSSSGQWIKVDAVTDIMYGRPVRNLRAGMADELLAARIWEDGVWRPSAVFEFVTLALHVLLDKASVMEAHRHRLEALAGIASQDVAQLPAHLREFARVAAGQIAGGRWDAFAGSRGSARAFLMRRQRLAATTRFAVQSALRKLGRYLPTGQRGVSVALLAPDGAGKSSLVKALVETPLLNAQSFYMGTRARRPEFRPVRFLSLLLGNWLSLAKASWRRLQGGVVVFDRYVYDSLLNGSSPRRSVRFRQWLLTAGWPRPDLTVVLDAPGHVLFERKREHSPEWLEEQRMKYRELPALAPAAQVIFVDATREFAEVRMTVTSLIWTKYAERNHG